MCHDLPCTSDLRYIWFINTSYSSHANDLISHQQRYFKETFDTYNYGPLMNQEPWKGEDPHISEYEPLIYIRHQVNTNREVIAGGVRQILKADYSFIFSTQSNNSYVQFSCLQSPVVSAQFVLR